MERGVQKVLDGAVIRDLAAEHPALEARVLRARFDLGENVGQLVTIGDAAHGDEAFLVMLAGKGGTNVQVLDTIMASVAADQLHARFIIFKEDTGLKLRITEVSIQAAEPDSMLGGIGSSKKLRGGCGVGKDRLLTTAPAEGSVVLSEDPSSSRLVVAIFVAVIRGIIGIGESNETVGVMGDSRVLSVNKSFIHGPFNVREKVQCGLGMH